MKAQLNDLTYRGIRFSVRYYRGSLKVTDYFKNGKQHWKNKFYSKVEIMAWDGTGRINSFMHSTYGCSRCEGIYVNRTIEEFQRRIDEFWKYVEGGGK